MNNRKTPTLQNQRSELENYLDYYTNLEDPGYAVLITGPWGSGKSHQTKMAIYEKSHYVSLFGLSSAEEVYSAVFSKMFPIRSIAKGSGTLLQDVELEYSGAKLSLGGMASGLINAFIREKVTNDKTIIFDDLERSNIPLNDRLGIINKYIEHHKCRVVVIAHDEKLEEEFLEAKEKLFGHSIKITPQYKSAFEHFADTYVGEEAAFLSSKKATIIDIVKDSDCKSLRILKRTIEDLIRIYRTLSEEQKLNEDALQKITGIYTVLSLATRSGLLSRKDIAERKNAGVTYYIQQNSANKPNSKPAILEVSKKHPTINLSDPILSDDLLIAMLFDGSFDGEAIRESLDNSVSYTSLEKLPPWRILMSIDEISEVDAEQAAKRMICDFENRNLEDPGAILHTFAFMLMMSRIGRLESSLNETTQKCEAYLDELTEQGKMRPMSGGLSAHRDLARAHGGYTYWVEEVYKEQFSSLVCHLVECGERSMRNSYPVIAEELLKLMTEDSASFAKRLTINEISDPNYARADVLTAISPQRFVKAFMGSPEANRSDIGKALKYRYNSGELDDALSNEASWLIEVINLLEKEKEQASPFCRLHIERVIPWQIKEVAQKTLDKQS